MNTKAFKLIKFSCVSGYKCDDCFACNTAMATCLVTCAEFLIRSNSLCSNDRYLANMQTYFYMQTAIFKTSYWQVSVEEGELV